MQYHLNVYRQIIHRHLLQFHIEFKTQLKMISS